MQPLFVCMWFHTQTLLRDVRPAAVAANCRAIDAYLGSLGALEVDDEAAALRLLLSEPRLVKRPDAAAHALAGSYALWRLVDAHDAQPSADADADADPNQQFSTLLALASESIAHGMVMLGMEAHHEISRGALITLSKRAVAANSDSKRALSKRRWEVRDRHVEVALELYRSGTFASRIEAARVIADKLEAEHHHHYETETVDGWLKKAGRESS